MGKLEINWTPRNDRVLNEFFVLIVALRQKWSRFNEERLVANRARMKKLSSFGRLCGNVTHPNGFRRERSKVRIEESFILVTRRPACTAISIRNKHPIFSSTINLSKTNRKFFLYFSTHPSCAADGLVIVFPT